MASDEEGLVVEGEGLEVAESKGEEGRGGEEGDEAAEVAAEEGGDAVGEMREVGRRESGESRHDYGFSGVHVICHLLQLITTCFCEICNDFSVGKMKVFRYKEQFSFFIFNLRLLFFSICSMKARIYNL